MVHFYRAAPQPKSETETYIMYGLVAIAIILGLFYLYRRNRRNNSSYPSSPPSSYPPSSYPSQSPSVVPVSQELYGTWKFYGQPEAEPEVLNSFLIFGANKKGNTTSNGFLSDIEYSSESQMIRGKKGQVQRNMKYRIIEEESIDDPKKMEKVLIIDYVIGNNNIPYKLSFVSSPTLGPTMTPLATPSMTTLPARPM